MSATTPPLPPRLRWRQQRTRGALLSSDDYGPSVEREAQGQVLWRVQHEGCWRKWELRAAVALVKGRTAASTATFLKCGAHALLGSLPVRAQWPGFKAAGPAACCQRVTSATLTAMYPEIRWVTASAWSTGRLLPVRETISASSHGPGHRLPCSYHTTRSVLPAWWDAACTMVSASSKSPRAAASAKRRACRRSCHRPSPVVATKTIAHTKPTRTRSIPRISSTPSHISAIALTCHRPRRALTARRIPSAARSNHARDLRSRPGQQRRLDRATAGREPIDDLPSGPAVDGDAHGCD